MMLRLKLIRRRGIISKPIIIIIIFLLFLFVSTLGINNSEIKNIILKTDWSGYSS